MAVAEVIADTHYGDGETRKALAAKGIDLVAPAPPVSAGTVCSNKDAFASTSSPAPSPARQARSPPSPARPPGAKPASAPSTCQVCPLASRCTKRPGGAW